MSREPYSSRIELWWESISGSCADRVDTGWLKGIDPAVAGRLQGAPFVFLLAFFGAVTGAISMLIAEHCIQAFGLSRGAGTAVFVVLWVVGGGGVFTTLMVRKALRQVARTEAARQANRGGSGERF